MHPFHTHIHHSHHVLNTSPFFTLHSYIFIRYIISLIFILIMIDQYAQHLFQHHIPLSATTSHHHKSLQNQHNISLSQHNHLKLAFQNIHIHNIQAKILVMYIQPQQSPWAISIQFTDHYYKYISIHMSSVCSYQINYQFKINQQLKQNNKYKYRHNIPLKIVLNLPKILLNYTTHQLKLNNIHTHSLMLYQITLFNNIHHANLHSHTFNIKFALFDIPNNHSKLQTIHTINNHKSLKSKINSSLDQIRTINQSKIISNKNIRSLKNSGSKQLKKKQNSQQQRASKRILSNIDQKYKIKKPQDNKYFLYPKLRNPNMIIDKNLEKKHIKKINPEGKSSSSKILKQQPKYQQNTYGENNISNIQIPQNLQINKQFVSLPQLNQSYSKKTHILAALFNQNSIQQQQQEQQKVYFKQSQIIRKTRVIKSARVINKAKVNNKHNQSTATTTNRDLLTSEAKQRQNIIKSRKGRNVIQQRNKISCVNSSGCYNEDEYFELSRKFCTLMYPSPYNPSVRLPNNNTQMRRNAKKNINSLREIKSPQFENNIKDVDEKRMEAGEFDYSRNQSEFDSQIKQQLQGCQTLVDRSVKNNNKLQQINYKTNSSIKNSFKIKSPNSNKQNTENNNQLYTAEYFLQQHMKKLMANIWQSYSPPIVKLQTTAKKQNQIIDFPTQLIKSVTKYR